MQRSSTGVQTPPLAALRSSDLAMAAALLVLSLALLSPAASSAASAMCTAETFPGKKPYASCVSLPTLGASLHYTYDHATGSLSVAFTAAPAAPGGWVAWAINPTAEGMVGSQALVAFKQPSGAMGVKTYNISAYGPITASPIAYRVSGLQAAVASDGKMQLFATLALGSAPAAVNQVWQVGSSVTNGVPDQHAFAASNLASKGKLQLAGGSSGAAAAVTPASAPGIPAPTPVAGGPLPASSSSVSPPPKQSAVASPAACSPVIAAAALALGFSLLL